MIYQHYLLRRLKRSLLERIKREISSRLEIKGINLSMIRVGMCSQSNCMTVRVAIGQPGKL